MNTVVIPPCAARRRAGFVADRVRRGNFFIYVVATLIAIHLLLAQHAHILLALDPRLSIAGSFTVHCCQIALLTVWCMLGPGPVYLRTPALIFAVGIMAIHWNNAFGNLGPESWDWNAILQSMVMIFTESILSHLMFVQVGVVAFALGGLRLYGMKLRHRPADESVLSFRFSMRGLLIALLVVPPCALLVLRAVEWCESPENLQRTMRLEWLAFGYVVVLLLNVWAFLISRRPLLWGMLVQLLTPVLALPSLYWIPLLGSWGFACLAVHGLLGAFTLLMFRLCGYRLERPEPLSRKGGDILRRWRELG